MTQVVQPTSRGFAIPGRQPVVEVVDECMVPCLLAKTEAERLEMAAGMWRFARDMYLGLARQAHPEWSAEQVQQEAKRRLCAGMSYGME
jgi:hypothetical protein